MFLLSQLLSVTHSEEQTWNTDTILSTVSFAPLILPSATHTDDMKAIIISKLERESSE